jgi:hypothetical protein
MNKNEHINKLIEEALDSVDDMLRATPRPFLLTRINARISKATESAWEKAGRFVTRPAVAFTGLCIVLLVNAIVIVSNKSLNPAMAVEQVAQNTTDEFSYTVATIYDTDNTQP